MKISVAICTWNRARLLDRTLESLSHLDIPQGVEWELLVVDNNSTEPAVPFVLDDWRKKLPLKTFIEKEQGHSAARNCAVKNASGDFLLWTDNDVLVDPNWLSAYARAFKDNPDAGFFGGKIIPVFEESKPDWIEATWDICAPVYAQRDLGDQPVQLNSDKLPYGASFAVRMDLQKKHLYDTQWGRKKEGMVGEDEVSVLRRLTEQGEFGIWVPHATLAHVIPEDRATEKYVAAYYFGQGFTKALKGQSAQSRWSIWWQGFWNSWAYRFHRRFSKPIVWVSKMVHSHICYGELAGIKSLPKP